MTKDTVIQFSGTIYEQGYGLLPQKVMRDKNLSPTAKTIYAYIVSFASVGENGERSAFPGVKIMMSELGIKSDDTFYRHRKQLIDNGYITIKKNRVEGKFTNNIYIIEAVPNAKKEEKEPHPKNKGTTPYPKKSSSDKSSSDNLGTNINRSIINRSKEEEEKERARAKENNIQLIFTKKYLLNNNVDHDTVDRIISLIKDEYTDLEIDSISKTNIKTQFTHMMDKIGTGEIIYDFAKYFVFGLRKNLSNKSTHLH